MYCPQCGSEYVAGVDECVECGVPLVDDLPSPPPASDAPAEIPSRDVHLGPEPEVVFTSGRADLIAIAKSILMSADLDFGVRGEAVQDIFGWGRFPAGSNVFTGPVEILVSAEDAADARALLAELESPAPASVLHETGDADSPSVASPVWRKAKLAGKIVAGLLLGWFLLGLLVTLWDLL